MWAKKLHLVHALFLHHLSPAQKKKCSTVAYGSKLCIPYDTCDMPCMPTDAAAGAGKYAGFALGQRGQIEEIYKASGPLQGKRVTLRALSVDLNHLIVIVTPSLTRNTLSHMSLSLSWVLLTAMTG